jgi:hypothetical protein
VLQEFTFEAQSQSYQRLFAELAGENPVREKETLLRRVA